jgi:DNA repair exonuclease SbcCD ATPase subunit
VPTPSIVLDSIGIRAFRSMVDEQVVKLPTKGMHLISGTSGAGKTTLVEALAYAFGYSNFSATELQSWPWLTKEPLRVVLDFATPGVDRVRLRRGKQTNIQVGTADEVHTSAKAVQEKLLAQVRVPVEYLQALTYRSQKTPGMFLAMTDSEKKSFLVNLLKLKTFEDAAEVALSKASALETQIVRQGAQLAEAVTNVPEEPRKPDLLDPGLARFRAAQAATERDALQARFDEAKALDFSLTEVQAQRATNTRKEWEAPIAAARQAYEQCVAPNDKAVSADEANLQTNLGIQTKMKNGHRLSTALVQDKVQSLQERYAGLTNIVLAGDRAAVEMAKVAKSVSVLQAKACDRCKRPWEGADQAAALSDALGKLEAFKALVEAGARAAEEVKSAAAEVAEARALVAAMQATDPVSQSLKDAENALRASIANQDALWRAQKAELRAAYEGVKNAAALALSEASRITPDEEAVRALTYDLNSKLVAAKGAVNMANRDIDDCERENDYRQKVYENELESHKAASNKVAGYRAALADSTRALDAEKDFLGLVRGFLAFIFDETLARIADLTNARLALIPNVSALVIRFESEREVAGGKMRQEIRCVAEKNGHPIPLKAGISGGMMTAVELAVDLSVADVIAERTGVYPGWLVLDECFEGLPSDCKTACFEMLKNTAAERAVFVIDHSEFLKEQFDSIIKVEFDGERSKVVL